MKLDLIQHDEATSKEADPARPLRGLRRFVWKDPIILAGTEAETEGDLAVAQNRKCLRANGLQRRRWIYQRPSASRHHMSHTQFLPQNLP
jgi:hypothetical protein